MAGESQPSKVVISLLFAASCQVAMRINTCATRERNHCVISTQDHVNDRALRLKNRKCQLPSDRITFNLD
jgi:hypothetical protein